jgi:DNA (cytosine-5)-methyltransferase 1
VKILNLYAGLGGNRKLWEGHQITAVEMEPKIAAVYRRLYPNDTVIEADAHTYLLEHHTAFDFVWTSPPCQRRSRMNKATRHKRRQYVDMELYQQVLLLKYFFKGKWVVENVEAYFDELIHPTAKIGRHVFWANFAIPHCEPPPQPADFINLCNLAGKQKLMDWLGIHYPENIYYGTNHCPAQILRNCVHPLIGKHVLAAALAAGKAVT